MNPEVIIVVVAGIAFLWGLFNSINRGKTGGAVIGLVAGGGGFVFLGIANSGFQSARRSGGSLGGLGDAYGAAYAFVIGVSLLLVGLVAVAVGATGDWEWPREHREEDDDVSG